MIAIKIYLKTILMKLKKTRSIYSIFIQVTLLQMEFFVKYGLKLEQVK